MKNGGEIDKGDLEEILRSHNIPLDQWGQGVAKTIDHLIAELHAGESQLIVSDAEIRRRFQAVGVKIWHVTSHGALYVLREDRQVFRDGRVRQRVLPSSVTEKMKPGENPEEAARRAVREELGIEAEDLDFSPSDTRRATYLGGSFPGIVNDFDGYIFSMKLPKEHFKREGYIEEQEDKTTYFVWDKQ